MQWFDQLFSGRSPRNVWWTWASISFLTLAAAAHWKAYLPPSSPIISVLQAGAAVLANILRDGTTRMLEPARSIGLSNWVSEVVFSIPYGIVSSLANAWNADSARTLANSFVVFIVLIFMLAPVTVRRLHDRGRSGWYGLLFLTPLLLAELASRIGNLPPLAFLAATVLILLWYILEMGILRGNVGANRFGADPVGPVEERYAAIMSSEPPLSKKSVVAAFARDPQLLAIHKSRTGEDLSTEVSRRGPPFRLGVFRLLLAPLIVAGFANALALVNAPASPYFVSKPDEIAFWLIWAIVAPAWTLVAYFAAMANWETSVKTAAAQEQIAVAPPEAIPRSEP